MIGWQNDLNGDPLSWLLGPENSSIRYWTLVELFDPRQVGDRAGELEDAVERPGRQAEPRSACIAERISCWPVASRRQ